MISDAKHNKNLYSNHLVRYSRDEVLTAMYHERYVEYRKAWNADVNNDNIPTFPMQYEIMLTDKCNMRCSICHKRSRTGMKINLDKLCKVIMEGKGRLSAISVGLDSEGLIDEYLLFEVIRYAKQAEVMDIFVATNGILLDESMSEKIIQSGGGHSC